MARVCIAFAFAVALVGAAAMPEACAQAPAKSASAKRKAPTNADEADKKPPTAAESEKLIDAAAKSLEAGKVDQAEQQLTSVLSGSRLEARLMARALLLRGSAYRRQGKLAQAISDLTSALWLKGGLSDADRALALAQRAEAYREAGLNDLADADAKKSGRPAAQPAQNVAASQASTASLQRDSSPTPGLTSSGSNAKGAEPTGSGVSNFFTNLFGGKQAPPATRKQAEPQPARQASIGTAWSETTTAARSPTTPAQEAVAPHEIPAAVKPAAAKGQGFLVQAAAVRSRPEADAIAARLKKDQAAQLGGRAPEVDSTIIGNMGTFYRVRIGPYANANEPQALCAKLRGIGLDCLILAD